MNVDKFTKLMQMTLSPNSNEALVALRLANNLLAEADLNWAEFIEQRSRSNPRPTASASPPPFAKGRIFSEPERKQIDMMFEKVGARTRGSFADFVNSLRKQWAIKKWLSERQLGALKNAYSRL